MSIDKQVVNCADKKLEIFLDNTNIETSHHRVESQETKCKFGSTGVCCSLCSNGPCRITPKAQKGICGASADTIVARNFLREVGAGSACYIHLAENAARALLVAAEKRQPIKGTDTLDSICKKLAIYGFSPWDKGKKLANRVLEDLYLPEYKQMEILKKIAPQKRLDVWKNLGILPGGAKSESLSAIVKTSSNLNTDTVDMLLHCLKLGISTGYYGLYMSTILNDILIGEPEIHETAVGLGVISPDYINILILGHQQHMIDPLISFSEKMSGQALAAGAKGYRIVGCTCSGQELAQRCGGSNFCGQAGNNFTSEIALATGCIDLVVSEFNCSFAGVDSICRERNIPQINLDIVSKSTGAKHCAVNGRPDDIQLAEILTTATEHYVGYGNNIISQLKAKGVEQSLLTQLSSNPKALEALIEGLRDFGSELPHGNISECSTRVLSQGLGRTNPLSGHGNSNSIVGFSQTNLKAALGGSWKALLDLIVNGTIKGICGVVGCSTLNGSGYDILTVEMTKELIKRDILVLSAGCTSGALENAGLMIFDANKYAGQGIKAVCQTLGIPPVLNFGSCMSIARMEVIAAELAEDLGVDLPALPLVISAPQWLEEQALADGSFALALGLTLHLGTAPHITGSKLVVDILTNQMKDLTGGKVYIENDSVKSADLIDGIIKVKREGLGI